MSVAVQCNYLYLDGLRFHAKNVGVRLDRGDGPEDLRVRLGGRSGRGEITLSQIRGLANGPLDAFYIGDDGLLVRGLHLDPSACRGRRGRRGVDIEASTADLDPVARRVLARQQLRTLPYGDSDLRAARMRARWAAGVLDAETFAATLLEFPSRQLAAFDPRKGATHEVLAGVTEQPAKSVALIGALHAAVPAARRRLGELVRTAPSGPSTTLRFRDGTTLTVGVDARDIPRTVTDLFAVSVVPVDAAPAGTARNSRKSLKTLAATAPHLASQWHPTRNGAMTPENTGRGSAVAVWWLCEVCGTEWQATPGNRASKNARGCPGCRGLRASKIANLATEHPELAAEWHPGNDGPPESYRSQSAHMARWRCSTCRHEWDAAIYSRTRGHGCPVCGGVVTTEEHSISRTHPELASQWLSAQEPDRTPRNVSAGSTLTATWQCPEEPEHRFERSVSGHVSADGRCPYCQNRRVDDGNCLATTDPDLAEEWGPANDLTPQEVTRGSGYKAQWVCRTCSRTWRTPVNSRTVYGTGCKSCVSATTSAQEIALRDALRGAGLSVEPEGVLITARGREWHCDIVSRELALVVEFDGSYWHRGKERTDRSKGTALRRDGWTVIRVREAPLEPLHAHDVSVPLLDKEAAARITLARIAELGIFPRTA